MLFNSIDFLFFLPIVIILYYLIAPRYRWTLLLAASYYFYMCWKIEYIVLILASTLIDYYCGIQMGKRADKKRRRPFLIVSIITNLGLLFAFKYFNFFTEHLQESFAYFDLSIELPAIDVLLPVGISFYTFQTLSYSIDVYKGQQSPEKHFGYFALYVAYFPQLVAGPIERFSSLAPQLKKTQPLLYTNISNGFRLILFGLFLKMVIADNLGAFVDDIYSNPATYHRTSIGLGMFFYSFQIYCDFFGYSIIAIGSARLMGIQLMDNFKTPYFARNISEFWHRWHISLSNWFRDYVYFPLGGNRTRFLRWTINILIVFVLSGLWHGANTTFVIWGCVFGVVYLLERIVNKLFSVKAVAGSFRWIHLLHVAKTFLVVTIAWVFFRSASVENALDLFGYLMMNSSGELNHLDVALSIWICLALFIIIEIVTYNSRFDTWAGKMPVFARWPIYFALVFMLIIFAATEDFPFIYFQF